MNNGLLCLGETGDPQSSDRDGKEVTNDLDKRPSQERAVGDVCIRVTISKRYRQQGAAPDRALHFSAGERRKNKPLLLAPFMLSEFKTTSPYKPFKNTF